MQLKAAIKEKRRLKLAIGVILCNCSKENSVHLSICELNLEIYNFIDLVLYEE